MLVAINNFRTKIVDINSYLLIVFAFLLPITVAGANLFAGLIFLLWLIKADFINDFNKLKNNKLIQAVLVFILLHIIGLTWTQDMQWGLHILKKELIFLFLPIFMLFIKKEHIKIYLTSFLIAVTISEILSYGVWFEIIPPILNATVGNPTVFMSHISYNPYLAIAIYLLLYFIIFDDNISKNKKMIYMFFVITMSINMFITGGRAGQIMYFCLIFLLSFQYFKTSYVKAIFIPIIIVTLIIGVFYNTSTIFHDRMNAGFKNAQNYNNNQQTSIGQRITYTINSFEIIKSNPIFGVGTGDFKNEYKIVNEKNTPHMDNTVNPHNMYVLELVQFGVLGLVSLLLIGFSQIFIALRSKVQMINKIGLALPILFGIIMLSDSYLLGHFTTMLFIFLSAILYKDYETN